MQIPISKRLLCCAELIPSQARVADIGTDHGYLPIYLLKHGLAQSVIAADLRRKPLENAQQNATRFGSLDQIDFRLSDGLDKIAPGDCDMVVCAGMGGDLIAQILAAAPWLLQGEHTLVLQPQSTVHALRKYLSEQGYTVLQERLVRDGGFLYPVMAVRRMGAQPLTPGEHFLPRHLVGDPLLPDYLRQIRGNLQKTVAGISQAKSALDREKLDYYATALREVEEMRLEYGISE